jgi:hypothetical protein
MISIQIDKPNTPVVKRSFFGSFDPIKGKSMHPNR